MSPDDKPISEIIGEGADRGGHHSEPEQQSTPEPVPAPSTGDAGPAQEPPGWSYAALKEERSKRQRAQEEIASLKEQIAQLQPQQSPADQFWAAPEEHLGRIEARMASTALAASEAKMLAEHGPDVLRHVNEVVEQAMRQGHPDLPVVREAMLNSTDPAAVALAWVEQVTGGGQPRSGRAPANPYPSNFASTRSVGARSGPAWSGPTPLADIFDRVRK